MTEKLPFRVRQAEYEQRRARYLPEQLARARLKVIHLEREAARLGLTYLLETEKDETS